MTSSMKPNKKLDTSRLRKFAQFARKTLHDQVSSRMELVLQPESLERRESPAAIAELIKQLKPAKGVKAADQRALIVERVAYTWFNRFCALRYMDINRYTPIGIVSPLDGRFQPEILADAKMGHINNDIVPQAIAERVDGLLSGTLKSADSQGEAYRVLFVAVCNYYHKLLPFMFESIADYTELLLPNDLLSGNSVLTHTREALLPANCSAEYTDESVEVIGWLYQFYISEKKDDVFSDLKKGKKITPENIPAATQLFTPHWIVRYLVENSLGRLWMLNNPDSKLFKNMRERGEDCYYIEPEEPETDFLRITNPEEIKICDPACGSGHMLTYAFDLLYAIYEEQAYPAADIPRLILTHNLYGLEIDKRAGELAAFALKAREKDRRFFTRERLGGNSQVGEKDELIAASFSRSNIVQPNICVLENIMIDPAEFSAYMDKVGRDLFSDGLQGVVNQWEEADNFGSLIRPVVTDVSEVLELLRERQIEEDLLLVGVHQEVLKALRQADYLCPKYHVAIANPPYMGSKGMNSALKQYTRTQFPSGKSDIGAAFIERNFSLVVSGGYISMITMQSWMFLSSYKNIRLQILGESKVSTLAHLGERAFDSIGGAVVSTTAFVLERSVNPSFRGAYIRLTHGENELEKQVAFFDQRNYYFAAAEDFYAISGAPLSFWMSNRIRQVFRESESLEEFAKPVQGATTSDNDRFLRLWHEVSYDKLGFGHESLEAAAASGLKWFPYNKGGKFRRWSGNQEFVVNYENDGEEIKGFHEELNKTKPGGRLKNQNRYFKPCLSWSKISTGNFAIRYFPAGFIFDVAGSAIFPDNSNDTDVFNALLNSNLVGSILAALSPTLNFEAEHVAKIPVLGQLSERLSVAKPIVASLVAASNSDWHSLETNWGFQTSPYSCNGEVQLEAATGNLFSTYLDRVREFSDNERKINSIVSDQYEVSSEIAPDIDDRCVTLNCNPAYRYDHIEDELEREKYQLADTMREFISFAVGCMLGRYSLDKPGLLLASQGATADDYRKIVPEPIFEPDEANVIPMLDGEWFTDDITERFKDFLKLVFGTKYFDENLKFMEDALYSDNPKSKKRKTIRYYFLKEFYSHHTKFYKMRPIYWLFSSPKGTFNALIYMHRYRPDAVSVVLNNYLREFHTKLTAKVEQLQNVADMGDATRTEKAKALKTITTLHKQIGELEKYEREILYPLAQQQIEIDLDDGVKVNYKKFGKALKKVSGLS